MENMSNKKNSSHSCVMSTCKKRKTEELTFHLFPKQPNLKLQWMEKCQLKYVGKYSVICSRHFHDFDYFGTGEQRKRLKKTAVPSLNLPATTKKNKTVRIVKSAINSQCVQEQESLVLPCYNIVEVSTLNIKEDLDDLIPHSKTLDSQKQCYFFLLNEFKVPSTTPAQENSIKTEKLPSFCLEDQIIENETQVALLELSAICVPEQKMILKIANKACQYYMTDSKVNLADLLILDEEIQAYTGVSATCIEHVLNVIQKFKFPSKTCFPPMRDCLILCLCKLRFDLSAFCLKVLFNTSATLCSDIFTEMIHLLAEVLDRAIYWRDREEVLTNLPDCFIDFWRVKLVFDVIKIPDFNSENCSMKFMLAVTPDGFVTFRSQVQTSEVPNEEMLKELKHLDRLIPFEDAVMASEGLAIEEECSLYGLKVVKPKKCYSTVFQEKIVKARKDVDETIDKMKSFAALKKISSETAGILNEIVTIIAGILNISREQRNIEEDVMNWYKSILPD